LGAGSGARSDAEPDPFTHGHGRDHSVSAFLLRHNRLFLRQKQWGARYRRWLQEQSFEHPADQIVLQEYVEAVRLAEERLDRTEKAMAEFLPDWHLARSSRLSRHCAGLTSWWRLASWSRSHSEANVPGRSAHGRLIEALANLLLKALDAGGTSKTGAWMNTRITPNHLARTAVVYVRQSTMAQVMGNLSSLPSSVIMRGVVRDGLHNP
jgi:hypothetical protein